MRFLELLGDAIEWFGDHVLAMAIDHPKFCVVLVVLSGLSGYFIALLNGAC